MIAAFVCALFVLVAGLTMLFDGVKGNDEIGKFFTGSGGAAALILGMMMFGGSA